MSPGKVREFSKSGKVKEIGEFPMKIGNGSLWHLLIEYDLIYHALCSYIGEGGKVISGNSCEVGQWSGNFEIANL